MDIRALSQLSGGVTTSAAAVPVDTRAVLSDVASNTALSDSVRGSMISAVAAIDSNLSGATRTATLSQVQGLGIYLRNSGSNETFPRWTMMTALRAYGLNLTEGGGSGASSAATATAIKGQIAQIAQSQGVNLDTAVAVAAKIAAPAPVVVPYTPPVELGAGAGTAAPVAAAPAPAAPVRVETVA